MRFERRGSRPDKIEFSLTGMAPNSEETLNEIKEVVNKLSEEDPTPNNRDLAFRLRTANFKEAINIAIDAEEKIQLKEISLGERTKEMSDMVRSETRKKFLSMAWGVSVEQLPEVEEAVDLVARSYTGGTMGTVYGRGYGDDGPIEPSVAPRVKPGENVDQAKDFLISLGAKGLSTS